MFLDALTVCIRLTYINAGNKKATKISDRVSCFFNENNMKLYKKQIDHSFFSGFEYHLPWIRSLRKSRDDLVHYFSHFSYAGGLEGDLTYDLRDAKNRSLFEAKDISAELQKNINNLTSLISYLMHTLPKRTESINTL